MAGEPTSALDALLAGLAPVRVAGVFVFAVATEEAARDSAVVVVREEEGPTVVVERARAASLGLTPLFEAAMITLTVRSELTAVGLTAAVAKVLADRGIACNVVAGAHHDHLFIPVELAEAALGALEALAASARRRLSG